MQTEIEASTPVGNIRAKGDWYDIIMALLVLPLIGLALGAGALTKQVYDLQSTLTSCEDKISELETAIIDLRREWDEDVLVLTSKLDEYREIEGRILDLEIEILSILKAQDDSTGG